MATESIKPPTQAVRRLAFGFTELDPTVRQTVLFLQATDGAQSSGILYEPPTDQTSDQVGSCAYLMHPRGEFTRHYLVPGLTSQGIAVFGHNSRYLNNDTDMVHERLLFDIAVGLRALQERGFDNIILIGNSGGGSLLSFYQAEASKAPADRLTRSPGGDPIDLTAETMPEGDLFIGLAAHSGQGRFMLNVLDPSLTEESDPESYDKTWDMYHPDNGYRPWPGPSHYDPAWLVAYRDVQRERSLRIDRVARGYIEERELRRAIFDSGQYANLDIDQQQRVRRGAHLFKHMIVYRTLANPWYLDPDIDPSPRALGSIFSPGDPFIGNYGQWGLARIMTPRAWLSTWSGTASHADLPATIRHVRTPSLIVYPEGDTDILPSEQRVIFDACTAEDKTLVPLPHADHYLYAAGDSDLADPRERVLDILVPWIKERLS
jgi:pimeloyl-ACP methyl ester carboxylesterase